MQAQRRRHEIQGVRGIAFAGAYWGYGFHEDGVQSGIEAARRRSGDAGELDPSCTRAPRATRDPDAEPARVRAAPVPRVPRRRRAPGRARRRPRLVGPPPRAGAVPRRGLLRRRRAAARRRRPRPRRGAPRPAPRRARPPARAAAHLGLRLQPARRLLLLGPRRARARRRRARGHEHARGANALVRVRRPDGPSLGHHAEGDARVAVPPDGRRLPRVVDHPRANGSRSTSAWNATATTIFAAGLAHATVAAHRAGPPSACSCGIPCSRSAGVVGIYRQALALWLRRVPAAPPPAPTHDRGDPHDRIDRTPDSRRTRGRRAAARAGCAAARSR